uniref:Odorant receptor n=1 Tax=Sirex noctilio TaxID=36765 RepID=A0A857NDI0_9HYME|nr:odorant receptor 16 [Sirex noctilio]
MDIIVWNRRIISALGLWPTDRNDFKLFLYVFYLTIHCFLQYADLVKYINEPKLVIANLTENSILTMVLCKIIVYRLNENKICQVLETIMRGHKDINISKGSSNELLISSKYIEMANTFVKTTFTLHCLSSIIYYLKPFIDIMISSNGTFSRKNESLTTYTLPYRINLFFEISELRTYVLVYLCQAPIVLIVTVGSAGMDCLLVTLTLHICDRFSELADAARKINLVNRRAVGSLVSHHVRVMRTAKTLDAAFNVIMLLQLLGFTLILCLAGYNVTLSPAAGRHTHLLTFLMYTSTMALILFECCYVGECLITESSNLHDAFYNNKWYDILPTYSRLIILCMTEARRPIRLTAGTFYVFSLSSFSDVLKSAVAYLSLLQKLV